MSEMIEIICKNTDSKILVPFGTKLSEVEKYAGIKSKYPILGAYVNNKVQNLGYKIFMPKIIEFIDIINPNGRRIYAMSLLFLLYKALKEVLPKAELVIHHSMYNGYYSEISNLDIPLDSEIVQKIKIKMNELVDKDISFTTKSLPAQEAYSIYRKVGLEDKAELMETTNKLYVNVDYLDDTINHFYYPLIPSSSYLNVFDLILFNSGILLLLPDKKDPSKVFNKSDKQKKMFSVFKEHKEWVKILNTSYVGELNKVVEENNYRSLIQVSEALHEKKYAQIADDINKRNEIANEKGQKKNEVKIIFLAGPSSSGKTTSCRRLATQLAVLGYTPVQLSLDDYFLDREFTPRKPNGDYDFENLEALDIELFNSQMNQLLKENEVNIPRFDFKIGKKIYNGNKIKPKNNAIFIVEGIHALNPKLSEGIDKKNKYNVFVSALTQISLDKHNLISTSDNRLIRRIVRDFNYRGYSAEDTLMRWQSVRDGEEKYIFPFQENADSIFNSSLLYEIGVLKNYAKPLLSEVPQNKPCYAEAKRLLKFLSNFKSIDDKSIPPTSIMREFLGGSSFEY